MRICVIAAAAVLLVVLYSFLRAKTLRVRKFTIKNSPEFLKGKRAVAFSDLHISWMVPTSQLARCVAKINAQHADYAFFLGDLANSASSPYTPETEDKIKTLLAGVAARSGKFAVLGNHDYFDDGSMKEILNTAVLQNGYTFFNNSGMYLSDGVFIAGTAEMKRHGASVKKALNGSKKDDFVILLAHQPDIADRAAECGVNLQLSGHSHGGQIYIPFTKSFFLCSEAKKYYRGTHRIKNTDLIISYGVGVHSLPLRFLAPPDIVVLDFK